MFKTKHTVLVNENVFQHLWFCIKVAAKLQLIIICIMLHGLSGGLWHAPQNCQIKEVAKWITKLAEKR